MPELLLQGPEGRLEARYNPVKDNPHAPIALILHPHPVHGGTMYNKVVHMMNQSFMANGFATLRFNFRGVGKSQGRYDDGVGETSDAIAALEWMQTMHKSPSQMWVAGFSFGSWIAMQVLMRRPELSGFVAISPPANMYDFSFLAPCPCGGLVVQGDTDKIVHEPAVSSLVKRLREQRGRTAIDYRVIEGANHFFQQHEESFQDQLTDYLSLTQNYRLAAE